MKSECLGMKNQPPAPGRANCREAQDHQRGPARRLGTGRVTA